MVYSREIEAGLRAHYPGVHIREWFSGEMSSRELLVLLDGFPDDSWYVRSVVRDYQRAKAEEQNEGVRSHQQKNYNELYAKVPESKRPRF